MGNPNRRRGTAHIGPVPLAGQLTAPEVPPRRLGIESKGSSPMHTLLTKEDKLPVKIVEILYNHVRIKNLRTLDLAVIKLRNGSI